MTKMKKKKTTRTTTTVVAAEDEDAKWCLASISWGENLAGQPTTFAFPAATHPPATARNSNFSFHATEWDSSLLPWAPAGVRAAVVGVEIDSFCVSRGARETGSGRTVLANTEIKAAIVFFPLSPPLFLAHFDGRDATGLSDSRRWARSKNVISTVTSYVTRESLS